MKWLFWPSLAESTCPDDEPGINFTLTWTDEDVTKTWAGATFENGETIEMCPTLYFKYCDVESEDYYAHHWDIRTSPGGEQEFRIGGEPGEPGSNNNYNYFLIRVIPGGGELVMNVREWSGDPGVYHGTTESSIDIASQWITPVELAPPVNRGFNASQLTGTVTTTSGVTVSWHRVKSSEFSCPPEVTL